MTIIRTHRLLKIALLLDAGASAFLVIPQLAFGQPLAQLLALPPGLLQNSAWFLLFYAPMLAVLGLSRTLWQPLVWLVILGNIAWSLASVALLMSDLVAPSVFGTAYVALQALAVLGLAGLEFAGLRASQQENPMSSPAAARA